MKPKALKLFHKTARNALAIRPSALSIYWVWGCGAENESVGPATVVHVQGPIEQRSSWFDGYDAIVERFRCALNEDPEVVILKIDSPGGECAGCFDAVIKMRAMAAESGKRIVAFADESAYSAAYAIACVADEIYLPRAGGVGSVGVIAVVADQVALNERIGINVAVVFSGDHKADCHPDIPLSDDALAGVQKDVDTLAEMFRELVAGARGLSADSVASLEAATFMGQDGLTAGLADGVLTFDELIAMLESDIAATNTETPTGEAMKPKTKKTIASALPTTDLMSKPQVAGVDPGMMSEIAKLLVTGDQKPLAAMAKKDDGSTTTSTTVTTEDVEADGATTTTVESEETTHTPGAAAEDDEEPADDEDDSEEEEAPPSSKPAARVTTPSPAAHAPTGKRTSADVLRLVAELTGFVTPAEQIGALTALRDQAASAEGARKDARKAARVAAKRELRTTVDAAISSGKLAPDQRDWAMSAGIDTIRGYLAKAKPLVRTLASSPKTVASTTPNGHPSTGNAELDASVATIASACMVDPAAVAAHAVALKNAGIIH